MKQNYLIKVYLERYDKDKYVKPFFINLPFSKEIEKCYFEEHWMPGVKLVDSKCFGVMFDFFYALSEPNEKFITLEIVLSDEKIEYHKGWVELERIHEGGSYEVHGLDNYQGESHIDYYGPAINITRFYSTPNPKYIYLKKI